MKEKIVHYKWIILICSIVILNFGWNLYNNAGFSQEEKIKGHESGQVIDTVHVLTDEEIPDRNESEEKDAQNTVTSIESGLQAEQVVKDGESKPAEERPIEVPIYICGEVINPGVYYVEENAIINEVVEKSGGFTDEADSKAINLASPVQPNEKIIVPKQGEQIDKSEDSYENRERAEILSSSQIASQPLAVDSSVSQSTLININTATKEQLMTLNGIGEVKANAIIVYRQENGGFKSIDEMMQISGIGEKTFKKIEQFITT